MQRLRLFHFRRSQPTLVENLTISVETPDDSNLFWSRLLYVDKMQSLDFSPKAFLLLTVTIPYRTFGSTLKPCVVVVFLSTCSSRQQNFSQPYPAVLAVSRKTFCVFILSLNTHSHCSLVTALRPAGFHKVLLLRLGKKVQGTPLPPESQVSYAHHNTGYALSVLA